MGQGGADLIDVGTGDDRAQGGDGNDTITGGEIGVDYQRAAGQGGADMIRLAGQTALVSGGQGNDPHLEAYGTVRARVTGDAGNDRMFANAARVELSGGVGADHLSTLDPLSDNTDTVAVTSAKLVSGEGADTIVAGAGAGLYGGDVDQAGDGASDLFVIDVDETGGNLIYVYDFEIGVDRIVFRRPVDEDLFLRKANGLVYISYEDTEGIKDLAALDVVGGNPASLASMLPDMDFRPVPDWDSHGVLRLGDTGGAFLGAPDRGAGQGAEYRVEWLPPGVTLAHGNGTAVTLGAWMSEAAFSALVVSGGSDQSAPFISFDIRMPGRTDEERGGTFSRDVRLVFGDGDDALSTTEELRVLDGGAGNDSLSSGFAGDRLTGGPGNDSFFVGLGLGQVIDGGADDPANPVVTELGAESDPLAPMATRVGDAVYFERNLSGLTFTETGNTVTVLDSRNQVVAQLSGVEWVHGRDADQLRNPVTGEVMADQITGLIPVSDLLIRPDPVNEELAWRTDVVLQQDRYLADVPDAGVLQRQYWNRDYVVTVLIPLDDNADGEVQLRDHGIHVYDRNSDTFRFNGSVQPPAALGETYTVNALERIVSDSATSSVFFDFNRFGLRLDLDESSFSLIDPVANGGGSATYYELTGTDLSTPIPGEALSGNILFPWVDAFGMQKYLWNSSSEALEFFSPPYYDDPDWSLNPYKYYNPFNVAPPWLWEDIADSFSPSMDMRIAFSGEDYRAISWRGKNDYFADVQFGYPSVTEVTFPVIREFTADGGTVSALPFPTNIPLGFLEETLGVSEAGRAIENFFNSGLMADLSAPGERDTVAIWVPTALEAWKTGAPFPSSEAQASFDAAIDDISDGIFEISLVVYTDFGNPNQPAVRTIATMDVDLTQNYSIWDIPYVDVSDDGFHVTFTTDAALDPLDTNGVTDVYVISSLAMTLQRVNVTLEGGQAELPSWLPSFIDGGDRIEFWSRSVILAGNGAEVELFQATNPSLGLPGSYFGTVAEYDGTGEDIVDFHIATLQPSFSPAGESYTPSLANRIEILTDLPEGFYIHETPLGESGRSTFSRRAERHSVLDHETLDQFTFEVAFVMDPPAHAVLRQSFTINISDVAEAAEALTVRPHGSVQGASAVFAPILPGWLSFEVSSETAIRIFGTPTAGDIGTGHIEVTITDGPHQQVVSLPFAVGSRNQVFPGTPGNDTFFGLDGNDTIYGQDGDDQLFGGGDNDVVGGGRGAGNDHLEGGPGVDTVLYEGPTDTTVDLGNAAPQATGQGTDVILGFENVVAGAGNDHLMGDAAPNTLNGRTGDDLLDGGPGADRLHGDAGIDSASHASAEAGLIADLQVSALNTGDACGDSYLGVENTLGSNFGNILRGNHLNNMLFGMAGDDSLIGRQGNDTL